MVEIERDKSAFVMFVAVVKYNYGVLQTTINLIERSNDLKDFITLKDPIVLL